jgi:hypothetical protein
MPVTNWQDYFDTLVEDNGDFDEKYEIDAFNSCHYCGGSGGGADPYNKCISCNGTGRRQSICPSCNQIVCAFDCNKERYGVD